MKKLLKFFNENKIVIIILLIFTFLVYGYAGFNLIINLDGVDDFIINNRVVSYKVYMSLGRWFWGIIEYLFLEYPSPVLSLALNGILFSCSGVILGKILEIKNKIYVILLSMIMIAFPPNIAAYSYLSWQQVIGIGYFLSIMSVYKIKQIKKLKDIILPSLLISFAVGIYQSFLPLIIVLSLITIILGIKDKNYKELFNYILKFLICGVVGSVLYIIFVKLFVLIFNIEMSSYQGASSMFNFNYELIKNNFLFIVISCFKVNLGNLFPNILLTLLNILSVLGMILYIFKIKSDKYIIYIILSILLFLSPHFLEFLNPSANYHLLTNIPYSIYYIGLFVFIIIFIDSIRNIKIKNIFNKVFIIVLSLISFMLLLLSNKAFIMAKNMTDASFNYLNRMQTKIEMVSGYLELSNPKKYYFYFTKSNTFPHSNYAYINELGITSSFLNYSVDLEAAFNILGENVVLANPSKKEMDEIINKINNCNAYPDDSGIFIINDIIVIII